MIRTAVRDALLDALALLSPVDCAGCGAPDRAVCDRCRALLASARPFPVAGLGVPARAALPYQGEARAVLLAVKDGGRTDCARVLARALRAAVDELLAALPEAPAGRVELCVIPSTRAAYRRRGYTPIRVVLRASGIRDRRLLRPLRQTADQAALGLEQRAANRAGSLRATPAAAGRDVVLVDDIVTTGATLREAIRALEAAGAHVVGAAAIARTPRRGAEHSHQRATSGTGSDNRADRV